MAENSQVRSTPALPGLLVRNSNFVLLWAAYGISAIGDHLSEMALIKERGGLDRPDVTHVQALLTFGFFLPFAFFGPFAGWWADRFSRKWTMIVSDILRAALMASLVILVRHIPPYDPKQPSAAADWLIVLPLLVTGFLATFFSPCRQAMLPSLIRQGQLVRANAMISAMGTIGAILSAVLAGKLVDLASEGWFDLHWNYLLDALTFLVSAACLSLISMRRARFVPHRPVRGVWTPLREGLHYVRTHRRIFQLILYCATFWGAAGVVISIVPALVRDVFGGQFTDAGIYRGLIAAGLAVGAACLTIIGPSLPPHLGLLGGLAGGVFWLLALDASYIFKLGRILSGLSLFGIGAAGSAVLITVQASIQRFVPDATLGRVFGVNDTASIGALVTTTGLIGLLLSRYTTRLDFYVPHLIAATALALALATWQSWSAYVRNCRYVPLTNLLWDVLRCYARFWMGMKRIGPCTIPREGAVIVAANHTAGVDPLLILASSPHRLAAFIVAQEHYRRRLAGWFMRRVDCIPIDRANPNKSFLSAALRLLRDGGCLGIFPQGTYVPHDEPQPEAKAGTGLIALRTGATVVPCHISGTSYTYSPFASLFRRHRARVRYGRPIDLSAYRGREREPGLAEHVSALIMERIWELGADPPGRSIDYAGGPGGSA